MIEYLRSLKLKFHHAINFRANCARCTFETFNIYHLYSLLSIFELSYYQWGVKMAMSKLPSFFCSSVIRIFKVPPLIFFR